VFTYITEQVHVLTNVDFVGQPTVTTNTKFMFTYRNYKYEF